MSNFTDYILQNQILKDKNYVISQLSDTDRYYINFSQTFPPGYVTTIFEYNNDKKPIGFIELNKLNGKSNNIIYIIYALDPKYRGQGIIQKLIEKACIYSKTQGFKKVISIIEKQNIASQKALEKTELFTKVKETKNEVKYECIIN